MVAFGLQGVMPKLVVKKTKLRTGRGAFPLFSKLHAEFDSCFLFESAEPDKTLGRFSFLGFAPAAKIALYGNVLKTTFADDSVQEFDCPSNPFEELAPLANACKSRSLGFLGGLVGSVSFDAVKYFDPAAKAAGGSKTGFSEMEFGLFLDGVVFDREKKTCNYVTLGEDRSKEVERIAKMETDGTECGSKKFSYSKGLPNLTDSKFEAAVDCAKEYVKAGDAFQIVLSRRREIKMHGGRLAFYEKLREINPSPYMYFLKFGEREIVGSSPEMLVRVENREVETFPIAGTRMRGKTPAEDAAMEMELRADEKEKAEHLMLVDLARNDVGRVSGFGSVKVGGFMKVKKFSHVMHLVSSVNGTLAKEKNCFDAFASVFPAGTVSGAPKLRAMEIISELEGCSRGPYAGGVGYFSFNGNCDFAISIRTLFANGKNAFVQAGAGIVYDSVPRCEAKETDGKMAAVIAALDAASGEQPRAEARGFPVPEQKPPQMPKGAQKRSAWRITRERFALLPEAGKTRDFGLWTFARVAPSKVGSVITRVESRGFRDPWLFSDGGGK